MLPVTPSALGPNARRHASCAMSQIHKASTVLHVAGRGPSHSVELNSQAHCQALRSRTLGATAAVLGTLWLQLSHVVHQSSSAQSNVFMSPQILIWSSYRWWSLARNILSPTPAESMTSTSAACGRLRFNSIRIWLAMDRHPR